MLKSYCCQGPIQIWRLRLRFSNHGPKVYSALILELHLWANKRDALTSTYLYVYRRDYPMWGSNFQHYHILFKFPHGSSGLTLNEFLYWLLGSSPLFSSKPCWERWIYSRCLCIWHLFLQYSSIHWNWESLPFFNLLHISLKILSLIFLGF